MESGVETRFLLPATAYFDDGWYDREQQDLFARSWHLAAAVEDLPLPGAYVTMNLGFDPVVIIRGIDGEVRAPSHPSSCISIGSNHPTIPIAPQISYSATPLPRSRRTA